VWDQRSPAADRFGYAVSRLSALHAMREDLARARDLGLVDDAIATEVGGRLDAEEHLRLERLVSAHDELVRTGLVSMWATEHEVGLAREGRLAGSLARRARLLRPLERVAARTRRLRRP
jgi:hypothetical protein